jgi:hypothetical protein
MEMNHHLTNPKAIAELGEKIYSDRYKEQFERDHPGKFVAVDVTTEKAYVGDTPEGVLKEAREDSPHGIFHLIQVGFLGAFRVSYTNHTDADLDWTVR